MHNKITTVSIALAASLSIAPQSHAQDDPWLWLEGVDDPKALDWVRAENADTAERLETSPLFAELQAEALAALNSESRLPAIEQKGEKIYNFWRGPDNPRGVLRRTTLDEFSSDNPAWETVIDIDALSKAEGEKWVYKGLDCLPKQPEFCLARLSPGGGDAIVTREFNAVSKTFKADGFTLPLSKGGASWIDQDTLFVQTDFGEGSMTSSGYPRIVKRWKRGTPLTQAETLYEGSVDSVSAFGTRLRSPAGNVDLVREGRTFWTGEYRILGEDGLVKLDLPATAQVGGLFQGRLVIRLQEDWERNGETLPQGASLIADTDALVPGGTGDIEVLVAPDETTVVEGITINDNDILVTVLDNVRGKIYRLTPGPEGQWQRKLEPFPDDGALEIVTSDSESGNFFARYESFTTPPTLYYAAAGAWQPQSVAQQEPTFDGDGFDTNQYFATSADGTRVPYFVVTPKGIKLDGSNPTHIFSYGGFRNALTPSYSGSYENLYGAYGKMWLERGGVFVLANIRGGGEFGPAWHAAALKQNREKAFEDFEAIADDLFERGITSPEHLGIEGRSNGGLLVGALMTRDPDQYGAVICGVPLLDMKRYHKLLAGASWMAEYGDPDKPEEWAYISEYSPYQNLEADTDYPATLFYTSTRDDRVHPGHARKMAAKMQDMGQEVWYYENLEGGHGGSSTNDQLAYRLALVYTHLWTQLD